MVMMTETIGRDVVIKHIPVLNEGVKLCPAVAKFQLRFHRCDTTDSDRHSPFVSDDALVPDWTV